MLSQKISVTCYIAWSRRALCPVVDEQFSWVASITFYLVGKQGGRKVGESRSA